MFSALQHEPVEDVHGRLRSGDNPYETEEPDNRTERYSGARHENRQGNHHEREHRHYYGMVFCVDGDGVATPPRIIAQRSMFPAGPAKRDDLVDVIFSGGLVRNGDGTATLFAGISDVESAYIRIPDPFIEFEA